MMQRFKNWLGEKLACWLPQTTLRSLTAKLVERDPNALLEALGPRFNRKPNLENIPFDLPVDCQLHFEHLAGLFASTALDHAVISMTIRQTAYLFGLIRHMKAQKVIEIGRYKGGSTLVIAAAMNGEGEFWSIDIGEKEARLHTTELTGFDKQIAKRCQQFNLPVNLIVADSRTVQIDTSEVDLVFIDGDHSYEGVKNDFERFGKRVRIGGAVLLDDAFAEDLFQTHSETIGQYVHEIVSQDEFKLVKVVNRLAHLERIR